MEKLPDFLIIGAGKSGTTSLDNYLKQHPGVFMSPVKEPDFFAYDRIDISTLDKDALAHYHTRITKIEDYLTLFKAAGPNQIIGETSNTYLVIKGTAETIKDYIPNVKLIAILRQPTERLYSRYLHLARENELPSPHFEDVLDKNSIWWVRNDLVKEGFYYENLSRYFNLFPKENIRVYLNEDLKKDSNALMKDLFEFIGVKPLEAINDSVKYNKSGFIKSRFYDKTLGHNSVIKLAVKKVTPAPLYNRVKDNIWLQKVVNNLKNANLEQPRLDKELHSKITRDIYADDIRKLQDLIGRDLSHWMK